LPRHKIHQSVGKSRNSKARPALLIQVERDTDANAPPVPGLSLNEKRRPMYRPDDDLATRPRATCPAHKAGRIQHIAQRLASLWINGLYDLWDREEQRHLQHNRHCNA
jgi:hypothetical protein